jgi:mevalonate kinase
MDESGLAFAMKDSYKAQIAMFPQMAENGVAEAMEANPTAVKVTGAGGGGYLVAVSETQPPNSIPIRIRRGAECVG